MRILAKGLPALEKRPVVAEDDLARHQTRVAVVSNGTLFALGLNYAVASELAFTPRRAAGIYQSAKHLYRTSSNVGAPEQRRIYAL